MSRLHLLFLNYIPSLSSNLVTSTPVVSLTKDAPKKNVLREDPPKEEIHKSTPLTFPKLNACLGDSW